MRRLATLLLAIGAAACTNFADPTTVVDLRMLAVKVEPSEIILDADLSDPANPIVDPANNPPLTVTPLIVDPAGYGRLLPDDHGRVRAIVEERDAKPEEREIPFVNTGMIAAGRLQSLIDPRDYSHDLLVMKVQLAQIQAAVKSTVPEEMWGEIIEKLEEFEQHPAALDAIVALQGAFQLRIDFFDLDRRQKP